jgi:hypothetical protein
MEAVLEFKLLAASIFERFRKTYMIQCTIICRKWLCISYCRWRGTKKPPANGPKIPPQRFVFHKMMYLGSRSVERETVYVDLCRDWQWCAETDNGAGIWTETDNGADLRRNWYRYCYTENGTETIYVDLCRDWYIYLAWYRDWCYCSHTLWLIRV